MAIPLSWFLILAGALFCIGLYGALSRKNAVGILMGIELMLNAVNINLVAFWRYGTPWRRPRRRWGWRWSLLYSAAARP
jgi:NADH-quinone oxidoreductase subunit K